MTDLMPSMDQVTTTDTVDAPIKPVAIGTACYLAETMEIFGYKMPTATKPRQLLALLMTAAGKSVTTSRLINELWEVNPPRTAQSTLQTYVMKVRRCFGETGRNILSTTTGGYCLRVVSPSIVDVLHFMEVVRGIWIDNSESPEELLTKMRALDRAFPLVRGPVLSDINCGPVLRNWLQVFNETQRQALCTWTGIALRLCKYQEVIARLLPTFLENPDNEDFMRWLMLALYCSNRGATALDLYRQFRNRKIGELGIEPGPQAQELHHMILRGDRELFQDPCLFI